MFFPIVCFVGGLILMGKTKPVTRVKKISCLGPKSGIVYQVEDFPEIAAVVVRAPNGRAAALFTRVAVREPGKPGLTYHHGSGEPSLLAAIRADFGVEQKLASVKPIQPKNEEKTS